LTVTEGAAAKAEANAEASVITGNSFILLAVLIVLVGATVYGLYTRTGSGINPRPWDGSQGAPGAAGREELSGQDEGEGSVLAQHGTDSHASERDRERERESEEGPNG
jgi:hypothetical protein